MNIVWENQGRWAVDLRDSVQICRAIAPARETGNERSQVWGVRRQAKCFRSSALLNLFHDKSADAVTGRLQTAYRLAKVQS